MAQVVVMTQRKSQSTATGLGITVDKPKFPQYANIAERRKTYEELNWSADCPVQVKDLVEAGLVFTGVSDSVRCYYCGGGLRNWEDGDDPWREHAKWYSTCPHLKLAKGSKYIQSIPDGTNPTETTDSMPTLAGVEDQADLNSSAALAVIEMGFTSEDIRKAIKIYKHRHGKSGLTGSELFKVVLELQENPAIYEQTLHQSATDLQTDDSNFDSLEDLEAENRRLREDKVCRVCKQLLADVVLLPCGHRVCCQCGPTFIGKPNCYRNDCSQMVNGLIKVYFAVQSELKSDAVMSQ